MQRKVYQWVESHSDRSGKTLDIGSLNVNGTLEPLFDDYIGLDMREGDNVDVVANSHQTPFDDNTFDRVVCVEMLEHDDNPFKTLEEIKRILKPNGTVVLAASGINFPKHSYPSDFFRYTAEGIGALMVGFKEIEVREDEDEAYGFGVVDKQ